MHCIHCLQLVLGICLLTGCWEKIEYRGSFETSAKSSTTPASPAAVDDAASEQPQPAPTAGERNVAQVDDNPATPPGTPSETPPTDVSTSETPPIEVPATDPPVTELSTSVEPTLPPAAVSTQRAAWILGSRFSLAALANDRGIAPEDVPKWFDEARTMAEMLNVPLATLPDRPTPSPSETPSREVLGDILNEEKKIGPMLATVHGDDHDAIFRLAIRTNLLRVLNTPGSKAVETLSKSIADLGPRTGLPIDLWQPLLDVLNDGAASAAIRTAVPQMQEKIEQYLAAEQ